MCGRHDITHKTCFIVNAPFSASLLRHPGLLLVLRQLVQSRKHVPRIVRIHKLDKPLHLVPCLIEIQQEHVLVGVRADDGVACAARPDDELVVSGVLHDVVDGGLKVAKQGRDGGPVLAVGLVVSGRLLKGFWDDQSGTKQRV